MRIRSPRSWKWADRARRFEGRLVESIDKGASVVERRAKVKLSEQSGCALEGCVCRTARSGEAGPGTAWYG